MKHKNTVLLSSVSLNWDGIGRWNPSSWKTNVYLTLSPPYHVLSYLIYFQWKYLNVGFIKVDDSLHLLHCKNRIISQNWWKCGIQCCWQPIPTQFCIDGGVQERCNSSALAMELRLSCPNPSIFWHFSLDDDAGRQPTISTMGIIIAKSLCFKIFLHTDPVILHNEWCHGFN